MESTEVLTERRSFCRMIVSPLTTYSLYYWIGLGANIVYLIYASAVLVISILVSDGSAEVLWAGFLTLTPAIFIAAISYLIWSTYVQWNPSQVGGLAKSHVTGALVVGLCLLDLIWIVYSRPSPMEGSICTKVVDDAEWNRLCEVKEDIIAAIKYVIWVGPFPMLLASWIIYQKAVKARGRELVPVSPVPMVQAWTLAPMSDLGYSNGAGAEGQVRLA